MWRPTMPPPCCSGLAFDLMGGRAALGHAAGSDRRKPASESAAARATFKLARSAHFRGFHTAAGADRAARGGESVVDCSDRR